METSLNGLDTKNLKQYRKMNKEKVSFKQDEIH